MCCICTQLCLAKPPGLQIEKYYASSCKQLAGSWHGFFVDQTDLFGSGGPWPITMSLQCRQGKLSGRINDNDTPAYVRGTIGGAVRGICKRGEITEFIMHKHKDGLKSSGALVARNLLIIKLPWQGAMISAKFLLVLKRYEKNRAKKV
jgi:hypothetical protein